MKGKALKEGEEKRGREGGRGRWTEPRKTKAGGGGGGGDLIRSSNDPGAVLPSLSR